MNTVSHCLNCHVPLVPGTGFCGTCGTPAGQRGAATQIPPPMPMPPAFTGGVSATVPLPAHHAGALAAALGAAGASMTGMATNAVAFTATRSSKRTLGFKARFRGIAELVPGGTTLRVKLEPGSIVPVVLILTILLFAGAATSLMGNGGVTPGDQGDAAGMFLFGPILLGCVLPYFLISRGSAKAVLEGVTRAIATSGHPAGPGAGFSGGGFSGGGFSGAGSYGTPPSPVAPTPTPPTPPTADQGVFDQLRELGTLREQGILSATEFDQARAALLAKIA